MLLSSGGDAGVTAVFLSLAASLRRRGRTDVPRPHQKECVGARLTERSFGLGARSFNPGVRFSEFDRRNKQVNREKLEVGEGVGGTCDLFW